MSRLEVSEIEDALDALLVAILMAEARQARRRPRAARPTSYTFAELSAGDPDIWLVEDLTRDPVGRACRAQIKVLGELLFRIIGSTAAMRDTLDQVSSRDPARKASRVDILDKSWNGVGDDHDRWWA